MFPVDFILEMNVFFLNRQMNHLCTELDRFPFFVQNEIEKFMSQEKKLSRAEKAFRRTLIELLKERSFDEITTTDIIRSSGYSRSVFYLYYEDKYHLADVILKDEAEMYATFSTLDYFSDEQDAVDLREHMYEWYLHIYQHVYKYRELYHLILHSKLKENAYREFCETITTILSDNVDKEYIPEGLDLHFDIYMGTIEHMAYIQYWDDYEWSYTPEYIAKQVTLSQQMKNLGIIRKKKQI